MADAYIYRKLINDYWFGKPQEFTSFDDCYGYLDRKIKSIPDGKSFIFLTDTHNRCGYAGQTPAIIGYIRSVTNIRKVIMGGDIIDREDSKYKGAEELCKFIGELVSVAGEDLLPVFGNHDLNTANAPESMVETERIPYTELEKILFSHLSDRHCEDIEKRISYLDCTYNEKAEVLAFSRLHYFKDDADAKLRYIVLETGNQWEYGRNGCIYKLFGVYNNDDLVMQYDWLYEVLMSTPEDYDVVVSGHAMVGYGGSESIIPGPLGICRILSGFKTCSAVTVENPVKNGKLSEFYAEGPHTYDFSSRRRKPGVVVIAGDVHWDVQAKADYDKDGNFISTPYHGEKLAETAVIVNVVQTDAYSCSHYPKAHTMTPGTVTEHSFDIVTIRPDGSIQLTRIGAGEDRKVICQSSN